MISRYQCPQLKPSLHWTFLWGSSHCESNLDGTPSSDNKLAKGSVRQRAKFVKVETLPRVRNLLEHCYLAGNVEKTIGCADCGHKPKLLLRCEVEESCQEESVHDDSREQVKNNQWR